MEDTLVSIIVPIYNVEKYLHKCLDSLQMQTYKKIEIILVNDCSSDLSKEIATTYVNNDQRFKLVNHSINKGLSASRNTGISHSNGDWLFFVDSDDWVRIDTIEILLHDALKNDSDVVMCGYNYVWDNGRIKKVNSFGDLTTFSTQKEIIALVPQPSATRRLYKREFFCSLGFDFPEEVKRGEDFPLTIPLLTYTDKISIVDEPLYFYYQRTNSISNSNHIEDFSFYNDIIRITNERINKGFEEEIEFRYILEIVYSKNLLLIKSKYGDEELKKNMVNFTTEHPQWIKNKYIKKMNKLKKIYILIAYKQYFSLLRFLIWLRDTGRNII